MSVAEPSDSATHLLARAIDSIGWWNPARRHAAALTHSLAASAGAGGGGAAAAAGGVGAAGAAKAPMSGSGGLASAPGSASASAVDLAGLAATHQGASSPGLGSVNAAGSASGRNVAGSGSAGPVGVSASNSGGGSARGISGTPSSSAAAVTAAAAAAVAASPAGGSAAAAATGGGGGVRGVGPPGAAGGAGGGAGGGRGGRRAGEKVPASLWELVHVASCFVVDGVLHRFMGCHTQILPGGMEVSTYLFSCTAPAVHLTEADIRWMASSWRDRIIVCTGQQGPPTALINAFLDTGAKAVIAPPPASPSSLACHYASNPVAAAAASGMSPRIDLAYQGAIGSDLAAAAAGGDSVRLGKREAWLEDVEAWIGREDRVPVAPHIDNHRVLTLLLPSAFDEYLSEPDYDKGPDVDVPAPAPAPRWGQPEDFTWDEFAVGADDDVQDAEEDWRAEGDAGAEGGTEADTEAATEAGTAEDVFPEGAPGGDDDDGRPHPSSQNRDSRPPSPRHKPNDHKRQAYTAAEKLKWVAQLDVAVSVRALARESDIHRKCLANWKRAADFLKEAHSARCRMHARGRASWYRPMEIKVYERLLDWRRKGTAVSVGRLQEWSRGFMKILYPLVKWKGSQRWSDRLHVAEQCENFRQFVRDKRRKRGIKTTWIINADQTPLWLEMPATTTVDQTGVRSVPIRSAGYQKERVTVMLACTADGMKLRPWVFFKRKTVPKGVFPPAVPADLIKRAFLTCGISNALDDSEDGLAMAHRRSQLTAEVDVDDSIIADGFFGNNCQEPESDEDE
ncbi:unnamed protein product [Closterium sp. NIES-53]